MSTRGRYRIPPASTLVAFESAARNRSFSQAAQELGTFQSAISRQIATLEKLVSMRLFERSSAGVTLTAAGTRLREAVAGGLESIHRGVAEVEEFSRDEQIVFACSHETSQLVLLPRYNALCELLGEHVRVRVLTYQQDTRYLPSDPVADLVFMWSGAHAASEDRVPVLREAARPVCAPAYADTHADVLNGPVAGWGALTFIDCTRPADGSATWDDWFSVAGRPRGKPRYQGHETCAYVLEAAAAGHGLALGRQGLVERYLTAGRLVGLGEGFSEFDHRCYCMLTEKGRGKELARKCLAFFEHRQPLAAG